jgi:hypothetical protein
VSSAYDIRRRTAEAMAKPVIAAKRSPQATIDGVDPVQQLPKHIPPTCRQRLAEIRQRCADAVDARGDQP